MVYIYGQSARFALIIERTGSGRAVYGLFYFNIIIFNFKNKYLLVINQFDWLRLLFKFYHGV